MEELRRASHVIVLILALVIGLLLLMHDGM